MALGMASADKPAPGQEAKAPGLPLKQVSSLLWASVFSFRMRRIMAAPSVALTSPGRSSREAIASKDPLKPASLMGAL